MSWFDDWWRKRGKKFRDIDDFDKFFEEILKNFERMFMDIGMGTPIVRGFSVTFGPDGKPVFREIKPGEIKTVREGEERREVEAEIIDGGNHYLITIDAPGLTEKNIEVEARDRTLVVKGLGEHKLYKVISLPSNATNIILDRKYIHGVLTIKIKKK